MAKSKMISSKPFFIPGNKKPLRWDELVEVLKKRGKDYLFCKIPVEGEYDLSCHLCNYTSNPYSDGETAWVNARWSGSGFIYMTFTLEEGDCGDEDGFDRYDGITLVAIAAEKGEIILPFTESESREAQWKSFQCNIEEPVFKDYWLYEEFKSNPEGLLLPDENESETEDLLPEDLTLKSILKTGSHIR